MKKLSFKSFIFIGILMVFANCNNKNDKPNSSNTENETIKQSEQTQENSKPEPKFIIYSGTITTPYYPDNPEVGGVTNSYTLKLSLDLDKASLNGPMLRIQETQNGQYMFMDGKIMYMSFLPTKDFVTIYNYQGGEFGTLYKTGLEY